MRPRRDDWLAGFWLVGLALLVLLCAFLVAGCAVPPYPPHISAEHATKTETGALVWLTVNGALIRCDVVFRHETLAACAWVPR